MIIPLILSGGAGSRLWPLSRELYPKQFHCLVGDQSMLQETVIRLQGIPKLHAPIIVCNEEHRFLVAEQLRQISVEPMSIYLEPEGRNTAPAVAVGALAAAEHGDPTLLVLPADHIILDWEAFRKTVMEAYFWAREGFLVTFGIPPRGAETGFGYIKYGAKLRRGVEAEAAGSDILPHEATSYRIDHFVEKPDLETAKKYVLSNNYLWNSGMFLFKAGRYLEELERYEPEMTKCCREALSQVQRDLDFIRLGDNAFRKCPSNSIDYAVMEKSAHTAVIPLDAGWSDVGSWHSLWEAGEQDQKGNVKVGDVLADDVSNSYLFSNGRLIAAIGLDNHIVVETADAVLVASKNHAQQVKDMVTRLKDMEREEGLLHKTVHRPWGSYQGVDRGERFQVKRLIINPGAKLSLQLHNKRSEHWVVVRGVARVTLGEKDTQLAEDESIYIPVGTKHQIENASKEPLEIIEVQTGSYLGEDDIVRFEDRYGRA